MNLKAALFSSKNEDVIYENVRCFFTDFSNSSEKELELIEIFKEINKSNIRFFIFLFEVLEENAFDLSKELQDCIIEYIDKTEDYKNNIYLKKILIFCLYLSQDKHGFLYILNKYDVVYRIQSMIDIYKGLIEG